MPNKDHEVDDHHAHTHTKSKLALPPGAKASPSPGGTDLGGAKSGGTKGGGYLMGSRT